MEFPKEWIGAHEAWEAVERAIPKETPENVRKQIEEDCYGVLMRIFGKKQPEFQYSGPWGPEVFEGTVETLTKMINNNFAKFALELILLRVEFACYKTRLEEDS